MWSGHSCRMLLLSLVYLSSLFLTSSSLFRAASVGGTGGDPFDDIAQMGLQDNSKVFRILNLLLWGEDDQAVPAFEASYIVLDGGYQGTQWPGKHRIHSHPEGSPRYHLTLESGDMIEWMQGIVATDSSLFGGLFLLNSLTFSIRRANGSLEEFTVGKRAGQPVSIMGPVAGFWGGIAGAFDQLGVYIDPTMWPARPTRLIKYPLHGRLRSRSTDWSYFDDAEALGYPLVTRIVNITVVHSAVSIHGIGITYERPFNGSLVYIEHGSVNAGSTSMTSHITVEMEDYVEEMAVEVGSEAVDSIPECLQFLRLTVFKSATDHKQLYSFGQQRLAASTTSGCIVALHGIKDSTCIQRLGGHVLAESSLFDKACPLPPAPANGYLVNTPLRVSVKSSVVFACNEGFELTQGGYLTCREDGFWDGETPVCSQRSVTNEASLKPNVIVGYAALGSAVLLLCVALCLVLVCATVTCLKLMKARKRVPESYYPEQVHYVREHYDGGRGGELYEPNNESAQASLDEKMAADYFAENDKSNLY